MRPARTEVKIAIFEALQYHGGAIEVPRNSAPSRTVTVDLAKAAKLERGQLRSPLNDMEAKGWVKIERRESGKGHPRMIRVELVEQPAYFDEAVTMRSIARHRPQPAPATTEPELPMDETLPVSVTTGAETVIAPPDRTFADPTPSVTGSAWTTAEADQLAIRLAETETRATNLAASCEHLTAESISRGRIIITQRETIARLEREADALRMAVHALTAPTPVTEPEGT